jgi:hypothetical protein
MANLRIVALLLGQILLLLPSSTPAAPAGPIAENPIILNAQRLRLGPAGAPEWDWFAQDPPSAETIQFKFAARSNEQPAAVFIRQDDVRQEWPVQLNGRKLGLLHLMEADLVHHLVIPPGTLRDGENILSIGPPKEADDIILHEIRVEMRSAASVIAEGMLTASVTDEAGRALPSRLTIVEDRRQTLPPLVAVTNREDTAPAASVLAVRPGVIYTGSGRARVGLPAGEYTVYATRGFEWSAATQHVAVGRGPGAQLQFVLRREVSTPGLISCDTHVHTFTYSRHGDATDAERMVTLAGEGIELPIATEHNRHVDFGPVAQEQGVTNWLTSVPGNEVTTPAGHFNIFPVQPEATVPDFKITDWPRLMAALRATPHVRVVVLNHPRNIHNGFQPFASTNFNAVTGENLRGAEFTFDAMELVNSSAQQSDYLRVFRDWMALLNHGYRITAVGSSDGHDVARYIVGQGRTYIRCPDTAPGRLNVELACSNLVAGHAGVSMGLLAEILLEDRFGAGDTAVNLPSELQVQVRVLGPSWVRATNVTLFANGTAIQSQSIVPADATEPGVKAVVRWRVPRPAHDVHWVALATGPGMPAPFWAIPRPYQPTSRSWESRVIAVTNPIWLDADGDGRFSPAREYARRLVRRHGSDWSALLPALSAFDESVAAQAASLVAPAGGDLNTEACRAALATAAPHIRRGFESYRATQPGR